MANEANLADIVRGTRIAQGLSQREVAERMGVDHTYISHLEGGRIENPSYKTVRKLAHALDVSPNKLMGWRGNPT